MNEERRFSGTTKECLAHFAARAAPHPEAEELLAKFTGAVRHGSVDWWLAGKYLPVGMNLIKIRYFLEAAGYAVRELEGLLRFRREERPAEEELHVLETAVGIFRFDVNDEFLFCLHRNIGGRLDDTNTRPARILLEAKEDGILRSIVVAIDEYNPELMIPCLWNGFRNSYCCFEGRFRDRGNFLPIEEVRDLPHR